MNEAHTDEAYAVVRRRHHPQCVVCSPRNDRGLQLQFTHNPDGSVSAPFDCDPRWEGYPNCLHGGMIATLLDAAMTNCLFARGAVALTAELIVRYREPAQTARCATVQAQIVYSSPRLYQLRAELLQDGRLKATAEAKFLPPNAHPTQPCLVDEGSLTNKRASRCI
jgi:acyl-coenzyme A thioesterase PaaI-like protein